MPGNHRCRIRCLRIDCADVVQPLHDLHLLAIVQFGVEPVAQVFAEQLAIFGFDLLDARFG